MRYLLIIILLVFSSPAFAQWSDNKIRVIQEDGTVKEVEIPSRPAPPPEPKSPPARAPEPLPPPSLDDIVAPDPEYVPPAYMPKKVPDPEPAPKRVSPLAKLKPAPDMPKPMRKPLIQTLPPKPAEQLISKNDALYIALSEAPAASRVQVFSRTYLGGPVYVVMFKTDQGAHEVIVDGVSGEVIKSGEAINAGSRGPYVPNPVRQKK